MKILNFGSINMDHAYQVPHFVQPGETISAVSQKASPGGKGLNQSIALARAGAPVFHAGCVGTGGDSLKQLLAENGVDVSLLRSVDVPQGNAVIQVTPSGENCILLFGGSNQCVTETQVRETLARFSQGDYLVLQNEINQLPLIVDLAYERGMRIVLNPSPYNDALAGVDLAKVSWLLVNEVEAEQIAGSKDLERVWRYIHERYPWTSLLVTLGAEGSLAFTARETVTQQAVKCEAVDTTAAGDTFTGYFIAGLVEGRSLRECMLRASTASGISVTRPGAANTIPMCEEVNSRLEGHL